MIGPLDSVTCFVAKNVSNHISHFEGMLPIGLTEAGSGHHPPTDSDQEAGGDVMLLSAVTRVAASDKDKIENAIVGYPDTFQDVEENLTALRTTTS